MVLDPNKQHSMKLFDVKPCLKDPVTDMLLEPHGGADVDVDGPIDHGLESEYEFLARLQQRHPHVSAIPLHTCAHHLLTRTPSLDYFSSDGSIRLHSACVISANAFECARYVV